MVRSWYGGVRGVTVCHKMTLLEFPLMPMGVLAHRLHTLDLWLDARPPISMSGNFLVHMSAESPSNISPNPSEVIPEVSEP